MRAVGPQERGMDLAGQIQSAVKQPAPVTNRRSSRRPLKCALIFDAFDVTTMVGRILTSAAASLKPMASQFAGNLSLLRLLGGDVRQHRIPGVLLLVDEGHDLIGLHRMGVAAEVREL